YTVSVLLFFFCSLTPRPSTSPLFPYTTLFRSLVVAGAAEDRRVVAQIGPVGADRRAGGGDLGVVTDERRGIREVREDLPSRTSRSEEHTSELQSPYDLVCRLLLEKKKYPTTLC